MATGLRRVLEVVLAAVLLLVGFAALLALFGGLAAWLHPSDDPQQARALRVGLELAFIVISLKGLLPQLLLASLIRPLLARLVAPPGEGPLAEALVLWVASALGYAAVGPLLLLREGLGLPALHHANGLQALGTFLTTTTGVAAAFWTARSTMRRSRSGAPERARIG